MKIHQLPNGARFEFEGEAYVKTGPLFGTGKQGQRLIPKYAVLKPLDGAADAGKANSMEPVAHEQMRAAFEVFYTKIQALVPQAHQQEVRLARETFLKALGPG